jgi:glycine betaine/proline transport system ATP-binding protein
VTHDFDEAIRLADRIAIMKDGTVIQVGRPEDLVLTPATDYVAEFTRDVQLAKVVSVGRAMRPVSGQGFDQAVTSSAKIQTVAAQVIGGGKPVAVTDDTGQVVGELTPDAVLANLIGREARS